MSDARDLTKALKGRWHGSYGVAACPVCQPEQRNDQNALSLGNNPDGRLLLSCKKAGCSFTDILYTLRFRGLIEGEGEPPKLDPIEVARREAEQIERDKLKERQAWRLWQDAKSINGTIAERYLQGRGITCPLPPSLRFTSSCWHPSGQRYPAMIALVEGAQSLAVHRTYLREDGRGKANLKPAKAMLGATRGGAVQVASAHDAPLVVAEGIETALSLACGLLRQPSTIWAALSTSGIRGLNLPDLPGKLIIAPDGDAPGIEAANALATRASSLGWDVSLLPAPQNTDWNDVLMKGAKHECA